MLSDTIRIPIPNPRDLGFLYLTGKLLNKNRSVSLWQQALFRRI
ncbi:hypothetical protein CLOSYM_01863 [[Clostridium] symbiosum ATCC 14940]|uniref:Uncharacterized protein n=1 Tax=[Clostridium] symbiosum ATCC 14940 TaxID=411472 RepID=A0ABC9TZ56_CLOSY|nr:hypothetical protein CLOSYM_01863 [[Clostridium] symbiosum ATCC 14940]